MHPADALETNSIIPQITCPSSRRWNFSKILDYSYMTTCILQTHQPGLVPPVKSSRQHSQTPKTVSQTAAGNKQTCPTFFFCSCTSTKVPKVPSRRSFFLFKPLVASTSKCAYICISSETKLLRQLIATSFPTTHRAERPKTTLGTTFAPLILELRRYDVHQAGTLLASAVLQCLRI